MALGKLNISNYNLIEKIYGRALAKTAMFSGDFDDRDLDISPTEIYDADDAALIEVDGELHSFGGTKSQNPVYREHCIFDGTKWRRDDVLGPYESKAGEHPKAVYDESKRVIYVLGCYSGQSAYRYYIDENRFQNMSNLSYSIEKSSGAFYNGEYHVCTRQDHYVFNFSNERLLRKGSSPIKEYSAKAMAVYDGKIHYAYINYHYAYNGSSWEKVCDPAFNLGRCITVVYNDELHAFFKDKDYIFNGTNWEEFGTLPMAISENANIIAYDGYLHILGREGGYYSTPFHHYIKRTTDIEYTELMLPEDTTICTNSKFKDSDNIKRKRNNVYSTLENGSYYIENRKETYVTAYKNNTLYFLNGYTEDLNIKYMGVTDMFINGIPTYNDMLTTLEYNKPALVEFENGRNKAYGIIGAENNNILFKVNKGFKVYTDLDLSTISMVDENNEVTEDGILSIPEPDVKNAYITITNSYGIVYIMSNSDSKVFLLSGMKLNGELLEEDGLYSIESSSFIEY